VIIGVTGRKGHGKDTVGRFLVDNHGFYQTAYANPIKEAVKIALAMTHDQLHGSITAKETIDPRYGITPRHAMQTLGTEWGRDMINKNVWALAAHARIEQQPLVKDWVITDLRFLNEASILKNRGGIVIKVVRKGVDTGEFEQHGSEVEISRMEPHVIIHNTGTLLELEAAVKYVMKQLQTNEADVRSDGLELSVGQGWARSFE
jgi:dephospho-CoA kinase